MRPAMRPPGGIGLLLGAQLIVKQSFGDVIWLLPSRSASVPSPRAAKSKDLWLPERERVRLGAGLEEGDLQRSLAYRVALAHELVQAALPERAVAVLVDVHAV
jgi:hypothetical protein